MGALDILAQVVKDHEAKKAYGTPFYAQQLAHLAQQQEAGDLANQLAQFKLTNEQDLAPIQKEALQATIPAKEAKVNLDVAKTKTEELKTDPVTVQMLRDKAKAESDFKNAKTDTERLLAQARLKELESKTVKNLRPPQAPRDSFTTINTSDDAAHPILMRVNNHDPSGTLMPFTKPGGQTGPIAPKANQQEATNAQYHTSASKALDALDSSIDAFASAKGAQAKAEALRSYQAQLALVGNIVGKASGDQRIGDRERPVYSQLAGEVSTLANIYDPTIAKRRTQEARKFLAAISPEKNPYGVNVGGDASSAAPQTWIRDPTTGKLRPQ